MPNGLLIRISADTRELLADCERIERGEMTLPTVSSIGVQVDGRQIEEFVVYLEQK